MARKRVWHITCDHPGCGEEWDENLDNDGLDVEFGIHKNCYEKRFEVYGKRVILIHKIYNFCPEHGGDEMIETLLAAAVWYRGQAGSDFDPDPEQGCFMTIWRNNRSLEQKEMTHQFPYDQFHALIRHFRHNFLSPRNAGRKKLLLI